MIDNFDELVARCNARGRRKMIRIALISVGAVLIFVAIVAGLRMALVTPENPAPAATAVVQPSPQPAIEVNASLPSPAIEAVQPPEPVAASLPAPSEPVKRLYAMQLLSGSTYAQVLSQLNRVPERYRAGTAVHFVNGRYSLRYIDIFDKASLEPLRATFKKAGLTPRIFYYDKAYIVTSEQGGTEGSETVSAQPTAQAESDKPPLLRSSAEPAPAVSTATQPKGSLFTVENTSKNPLQAQIDSYNALPRYDTALSIAKSYYASSNFADAAVWAKKANQLNREGEEAWLLSAKSYYAQGRKNEAIGVLELYLNYKDSKAAVELLRSWKRP